MKRSQIALLSLVLLLAVLTLPALARADDVPDGWTGDEPALSVAVPDGWTWDEATLSGSVPDGWTWDEATMNVEPAPDGWTWDEAVASTATG
jgi:hypothetical protein